MERQAITSQAYFRALTILHAALMLGTLMIGGMFYFIGPMTKVGAGEPFWVYIAGGITIFGVLASTSLFSAQLNKVRSLPDLSQKLAAYRNALAFRYILLEAPAIIVLVGYFMTNNLLLLIFPGLLLLLLLQYRPTKEKTISDLELSASEQALVNNPDAIVTEMEVSEEDD